MHPSDLWEMSARPSVQLGPCPPNQFSFGPADLEVNLRERNQNAVVLADDAETGLGVSFGNDSQGKPLGLRTGPQFAFDVGLNEAHQPEMRFVYVAVELDPTTQQVTNTFLQGGWCTTDLNDCIRPSQWRAEVTTFPGVPPSAYFPGIKYGVAPQTGLPSWKVTWQLLNGQQVAVIAADLQRPDLVPGSSTFTDSGLTTTQVTALQTPCPDLRSEFFTQNPLCPLPLSSTQYWGDYDGMAYDPTTGHFMRAFTDSSMGCDSRGLLTAHNVHVSEVDMDAFGAPRAALVSLSNIRFGTTGFNVCSPSNNAQTINGENANGDIVIQCDPTMSSDGSVVPVQINAPDDECSCGDGHGALILVSCGGHAAGSTSLDVDVTLTIEEHCGSMQENTANAGTYKATDLAPGASTGGFAYSCDEFGSSPCANGGACVFNSFTADISVENVNAL